MRSQLKRAEAATDAASSDTRQYLTFTLGGEMFAFGILGVREIIEYHNITTVPMMPRFVRGVINLRGNVVPVIDLSARFGNDLSAITRRTCIVVLEVGEGERQEIGVVVDGVSAVMDMAEDEIEPSPSFGAQIRADFITGMGKVNEQFVMILSVEKVLSLSEINMLAKLAGDTEAAAAG